MNELKLKSKKLLAINYSMLIILPKVWTTHHSLKKGDSLICTISDDGALILRPEVKECSLQN